MKYRRKVAPASTTSESLTTEASDRHFMCNFIPERKTRITVFVIAWTFFQNLRGGCTHTISSILLVSAFPHPLQEHKTAFSTALKFANDEGRTLALSRALIRPTTKQTHREEQVQVKTSATPPWIPKAFEGNRDLLRAQTKYNLHRLNEALERHALFSKPDVYKSDNYQGGDRKEKEPGYFTKKDIDTVMEAIFVAAKNDYRLIMGAADFLTLLLSVEEYNEIPMRTRSRISNTFEGDENCLWEEESNGWTTEGCADDEASPITQPKIQDSEYYAVMTRDVLVASAFHYCDCVLARESGIYDLIENLMWSPKEQISSGSNVKKKPSKVNNSLHSKLSQYEGAIEGSVYDVNSITSSSPIEIWETDAMEVDVDTDLELQNCQYNFDVGSGSDAINPSRKTNMFQEKHNKIHNLLGLPSSVEEFGQGAAKISQSAAKIKKAEIMSHSVILPQSIKRVSSTADAASRRGLLLSMSSDWRALAIRSSASLYRIKGLLRAKSSYNDRGLLSNAEMAREAREAMNIYAPLAERLGMHRLKSELENAAFQVLYRRQHKAAMSIYAESGAAIQSVTDFLRGEIEELLAQDAWLSPQLERLTVTSRVKKPFSLWKKVIKTRIEQAASQKKSGNTCALSHRSSKNISINSVLDAIAIRVIIKAKEKHDEDEQTVQSREKLICYYIQSRLLQVWRELSPDRIKDYISAPKPNGYQSLHHTSECFRYGCFWPFEVQIRSEDMHHLSEYGVAAHWDYKLKGSGAMKKGNPNRLPMIESATIVPEKQTVLVENSRKDITSSFFDLDTSDLGKVTSGNVKIEGLTHSSALKSYTSALDNAREHLIKNSVFVFFLTSTKEVQSKVIGLPVGTIVADALIEICDRCNLQIPASIGSSGIEIFLNGEHANLYDVLNNGDTLMIPTFVSTSILE